jgi:hypothetical protein
MHCRPIGLWLVINASGCTPQLGVMHPQLIVVLVSSYFNGLSGDSGNANTNRDKQTATFLALDEPFIIQSHPV